MRKIIEYKWDGLLPIWNDLYERNSSATPFQSYDFLTFTGKVKPYRKDLFRLVGVKEWNLVLIDDDTPIAIAPLLIKKVEKRYTVYLRGHYTVANELDFIYATWSFNDFKFLMDYIYSTLVNPRLVFDRVSERTSTCAYLKDYLSPKKSKNISASQYQ